MDDVAEELAASAAGIANTAASSVSHFISHNLPSANADSGDTTPGGVATPSDDDDEQVLDDKKRYQPRTFPYFKLLPFPVEAEEERDVALKGILHNLYIAIRAVDFAPGALHWSRELQGWLSLKFEMTRKLRAKLTALYYHLALAPGLESGTAERFARMAATLVKKNYYLKPGQDLILDWRPLWKNIKSVVLPDEVPSHQATKRRSSKYLQKLCLTASPYFDPKDRKEMLEEFLPYFNLSDPSNAFIVAYAINCFVPAFPGKPEYALSQPADFLPTYFHLWSLMGRSKLSDTIFIDTLSRISREFLHCTHVDFGEHGVFTREQSDVIFTAILRLTEIPVGQANSPYGGVDHVVGEARLLEKDNKKYPVPYMASRWIIYSLSSSSPEGVSSVLASLEGLMSSIETFFHPSNQGAWTLFLAQFTFYLTDTFLSRWNREQRGEFDTPPDRRIDAATKKRFVIALREVMFMGLFAKSSKVGNYYYTTLQGLAYLEPDVILPGALQRFYSSLQGLVAVHRTTSSLCGLQMLANIMSKHKGYRCHLTALLALALPGIDANDLGKTQFTLNFIQSVAYSIPFVSLIKEGAAVHDTSLAVQWVQGEMERMERLGQNLQISYEEELSDEDEANILRSSTAEYDEFVRTLLGKVFTVLENLPDASLVRSGSPEQNVVNTLPAALTPLFASLSPDIYDMALELIVSFVSSHVVHQARDAMAWICNAICKVNPEKALKLFLPMLIVNIRNEIDHNGASSDRSSGHEILPRDRALVWHVSMLSMCTVHVGKEVLKYKDDLLGIARYMQERCRGLPTIHISNFTHHLLLNLTHTYPIDYNLYEPEVIARGLDVDDWGRQTPASELTIQWHRPTPEEVRFAIELFESEAGAAQKRLVELMSDDTPVSRKGKSKEWGDEFSRQLHSLRLSISGVSVLFDPKAASGQQGKSDSRKESHGHIDVEGDAFMEEDNNPLAEVANDEDLQRAYRYPAGYILKTDEAAYVKIHKLRTDIGQLLSKAHKFLNTHQEDDVVSFTALYSTYRTWITDVGIERSAHPVERLIKLYNADIYPFKITGLRKNYPRPHLIKRADAYHLQRVKYNASHRPKSDLDRQLLLDLAESCVAAYADVRCVAQGAQDSSLKVLIGGRTLVIPVLLAKFRKALDDKDLDRIKGAMYTLLYTSLTKTVMKDWRFAPEMVNLYIRAAAVDKQSIQTLSSAALFTLVESGKLFERMVIYDRAVVDAIKPEDGDEDDEEEDEEAIETRNSFIQERRKKVEEKKAALGLELIQQIKTAHWKVATRCAIFATSYVLRMDTLVPPEFIDLVVRGTNDTHPSLRTGYQAAFTHVFRAIDMRCAYGHKYENFLLEKENDPNKIVVQVPENDPEWTNKHLDDFAVMEAEPDYYVDSHHPGWLVWGKSFIAHRADRIPFEDYDETEQAVRNQIGKILTKEWFAKCFEYMKQEPRDASTDRFSVHNWVMLTYLFDLVNVGIADASFDDITVLIKETYGDGSDKHQHRATAEMVCALLSGVGDDSDARDRCWDFAAPMLLHVITDKLTPDNLGYWVMCLHLVLEGKDPRRCHEIVEALGAFRVDMSSNAAFKESSKVHLLEFFIAAGGWHYRDAGPILQDLLAHIDHPYKPVRESMGRVIAAIYRARYHESFANIDALLEADKRASSIGLRPYNPDQDFSDTITEVFGRLEKWRHERTPGQNTPSSYTSGSKTVLVWLDTMLGAADCTRLVPFFPQPMLDELLHMMDVKEDPELMRHAYHVYRLMPNIPFREGEDGPFIAALARLGKSSTSWHQRLRALVNMQVIYFRRLFLTAPKEREVLFTVVGDMLSDPQLEVREYASSTLAGMIRCSPTAIREPIIPSLVKRFKKQLAQNPMPKKKLPGTDTTVDSQKQLVRRHAAVLGLGALIEAFPYATPPLEWMPDVLAHLARRAAGDSGVVGKTTKAILADFKKTRQDSWLIDHKFFTTEQLEDLEGVLWKSYFA